MARTKFFNPTTGQWEYADDTSSAYPIVNGETQMLPDRYHVFGEVDSLDVTLVEVEDGCVHEYCFEFIPSESFSGLTVTPKPQWVTAPQFPAGKTCQVSIMRGLGVMICA